MKKRFFSFCSLAFSALGLAVLIGCAGSDPVSSGAGDAVKKAADDSLYTRIGGQAAIDAAVDAFYVKVLAYDRVNSFFDDVNMKKQHKMQKQFIASALGGPVPYEGRDMRKAHASLDLTDDDFNVIAGHLQSTLEDLKVDPGVIGEVMTAVGGLRDEVLNRDKPAEK